MCITLLITVFAILLGRKKDSGIIKVISFLGCYSCFLPVGFGGNNVEFATVTGILFVINIMTICLPVKKAKNVVNIVHMISNTIFTFLMAVITYTEELDARLPILYVCTNLLVIGIIFRVMEREEQKTRTAGMYYDNSGNIALYIVMLFVQSIAYICCSANAFGGIFKGESAIDPIWFHVMMATFVLVAAILFVLFIKSELKWIQYYVTAIVVFYTYSMIYKVSVESAMALLVIFVISKLLSRVKALKVSEMIITLITVCTAFIYWIEDAWYGSLFAAAFLLSILALYHFKPFYQTVITFALICYLTISLGELPLLPAVNVSVLFLLLLLFNNVKWWRGRKQAVYNYGNLAFMLFWCVAAIFVESYLNCAILALLGTAVVVLGFQKKYAMDFRFKYLFLVLFWTYMTFISRIEIAVVLSSILMVIAIASVVLGFALKRREVRIYGLVLSILVCLKVVFYDFMETPMLEKMILFLIVGVIILAISGIYIVLEKKLMNRGGSI